MTRVIVTDDSAFMRKILSDIIDSDPELEVVATAKDGQDLLDKVIDFKPDVITLDISMPVMDGLSALKRIMDENPMPVVMISALSDEENVFSALEMGAVDFIPKTSGIISIDIHKKKGVIIEKIKAAAQSRVQKGITEQNIDDTQIARLHPTGWMLCIAGSTGGPKTIESFLQALPAGFTSPVIVLQRIPREFCGGFVRRLNKNCSIAVKEVEDNELIRRGFAYVVPVDSKASVRESSQGIVVKVSPLEEDATFIDLSLKEIAHAYKDKALAIIVSGMGEEGKAGAKEIKDFKGTVICQDEASAIMPTLPTNVIKAGVADHVVHTRDIADKVMEMLG